MEYMFRANASGEVFALTLRQYRRISWALHDLEIAAARLRLSEKCIPYQQYRAERLGACVASARTAYEVSVYRSSRKDMDLLDDSSFTGLDCAILALSNHPTPRGRKRLKWLNPDLWITRGADCLIVYAVDEGPERLRILKVSYHGKRVPRPQEPTAKRKATLKPRVSSTPKLKTAGTSGTSADKGPLSIDLDWQDGYCGQTVHELLSFEKCGKTELLVAAFTQAIRAKVERRVRLSPTEGVILAVGTLDSTMVTEGFDHFFRYSPQLVPTITDSLLLIGCKRIAEITQRALRVLRLASLSTKQVNAAMTRPNKKRDEELSKCDASYWKAPGPSRRLFAFIKAHEHKIQF
jgi:hypothetical protein